MEAIERMAALCLRDEEEEDDEELGDEADLMVKGAPSPRGRLGPKNGLFCPEFGR